MPASISYPPEPTSLESALEECVEWRQQEDAIKWWHGWRYIQIRSKWPGLQADEYAARVGLSRTSFRKMYKTASIFQPEHINQFPGVPFAMWERVADIGETDLEEAMGLIEKAYDEPGITIGDFDQLVDPFQLPANSVQPLYLLGHLIKPFREGTKLEVVLILDTEIQDWESLIAAFPLIGKPVEVIIRQPKAVM